jgi:histidine triad (HIT) family protein
MSQDQDCIFCKIIGGDIPAERVLESEEFLAIPDINPKAPVHLLVLPKGHVPSLEGIGGWPEGRAYRLLEFLGRVAEVSGVRDSGYRVVINNGPDAGQEVDHLHIHVLGGQYLGDAL